MESPCINSAVDIETITSTPIVRCLLLIYVHDLENLGATTISKRMHVNAWFVALVLLSGLEAPRGALVNITVDDQNGDSVSGRKPTYSGPPGDAWEQGAICGGCGAQPNASFAFDGTWQDATWHPGDSGPKVMEVDFNGSAIYVFVILANTIPYVTTLTNLSFSIDGEEAGNFMHLPSSSTDYEYNVPAFVNTNLENKQHSFIMQTTAQGNASLVLFDYLIYSADDETAVTTASLAALQPPKSIVQPSPTSSVPPSPSPSPSPTTPAQSKLSTLTSSTFLTPNFTTSVLISSGQGIHPPSALGSQASPTTPTQPEVTSRRHHSIDVIIGAALGGLAVIVLLISLSMCRRWRKNGHTIAHSFRIKPYTSGLFARISSLSANGEELDSDPETNSSAFTYTTNATASQDSTANPEASAEEAEVTILRAGLEKTNVPVLTPESEIQLNPAAQHPDLDEQVGRVGKNVDVHDAVDDAVQENDTFREGQRRRHTQETDGNEALRDQVVFLLDELNRLQAQQGIFDEPPPDYST